MYRSIATFGADLVSTGNGEHRWQQGDYFNNQTPINGNNNYAYAYQSLDFYFNSEEMRAKLGFVLGFNFSVILQEIGSIKILYDKDENLQDS